MEVKKLKWLQACLISLQSIISLEKTFAWSFLSMIPALTYG